MANPIKEEVKRPTQSPVIKRMAKGMQVFSQDLFKLHVAKRLFNMSWQTYRPRLEEHEHTHYYRSVNDLGVKNEYSTSIGGHFHKVDVTWNEDGSLKETLCGPPLQRAPITLPGSKRKVMKIANIFFVKETENGLERIEDNHSHAMEYRHTDEVCPTQRTDATNAEKEKVQIMMHQARLAAGELSNSQSSNFVVEE